MKKAFTFLGLVVLLTFNATAQKSEEKLVQKAFEAYKNAILTDQGEKAAMLVDSKTIKYYSNVLEWVKTADSAKLSSLSLMDKFMVLIIKHRTSKEDIFSFDGKKLFVYAVNKGMVGKSGMSGNETGKVTVQGNFASAEFIVSKEKTGFSFEFYKENGQWKIDLTHLFPLSNLALQAMITESGQTENEYIFSMLEILTGKKPGSEIWQPVK